MVEVRKVVTLALEARTKSGMKVRQPLQRLEIFWENPSVGYMDELIMDEINVKEILHHVHDATTMVTLDTTITPELRQEGEARELMRAIQDARKELGLTPQDKIVLAVDETTLLLVRAFEAEVTKTVGAREVRKDEVRADRALAVNDITYRFGVMLE